MILSLFLWGEVQLFSTRSQSFPQQQIELIMMFTVALLGSKNLSGKLKSIWEVEDYYKVDSYRSRFGTLGS